MGSLPGFEKGRGPALDGFRENINRWNVAVDARARAVPLWRKLLSRAGFRGPSDDWQFREPIWNYYPPRDLTSPPDL